MTITAEGRRPSDAEKMGLRQVQGFYYGKPDADVPEFEEQTAKQPKVA